MKITLLTLSVAVILALYSCNNANQDARNMYFRAVELYKNKNYVEAKNLTDSIKIIAPKSFDEIRAGIQLSRKAEYAINSTTLRNADSLLLLYKKEQQKLLEDFDCIKNEEYQTEVILVYKNDPNKLSQTNSCLRAQVTEKGELQLLSIYCGIYPLQHEAIRVSIPSGSYAMTAAVPFDGANNYRYKLNGKYIETITYKESNIKPIADFILAVGNSSPIKINYEGKKPFAYNLSKETKKAILESYRLSTIIKAIKSLERDAAISSKTMEILKRQIEEHKQDSL